ncbi:hypothetical protein CNYM01_01951 [Colletotrichum nymphaeae SA-01]|uniref:Uncharacterized protein n=1 Tax=Colletotrichum nymphaeae SA-01 TaxID=1460502 RepID=A0A135TTB7_9PEZI|nr:hypothetical protein CNYM01_01951 [Colletotrichum nymphaeae SA-01]
MTITSLQDLRKQATPSVELKRIKHYWLNLIPWDARGTDNDGEQHQVPPFAARPCPDWPLNRPRNKPWLFVLAFLSTTFACLVSKLAYSNEQALQSTDLFRGVQRVKDHPEFPLYASFQAGECDEAQWPGDWNHSKLPIKRQLLIDALVALTSLP